MITTAKQQVLTGVAIGLLALLGATLGGATAHADSNLDKDEFSRAELSQLDAAEIDLLNSGDPVTITVDPATGLLLTVDETAPIEQ